MFIIVFSQLSILLLNSALDTRRKEGILEILWLQINELI